MTIENIKFINSVLKIKTFFNRSSTQLKLDRARIQIGRISNFGLLEMTRQRLKESSIKWEINLSLESFAQKILKKIEALAFSNKTKIVSAFIPNKVSSFLNHFNVFRYQNGLFSYIRHFIIILLLPNLT